MLPVHETAEIYYIAKELIEGLDNDIDEVAAGLEKMVFEKKLTMKELRELCWEDSVAVFDYIYG